jgi:uncharacterized protein (DUF934 family)
MAGNTVAEYMKKVEARMREESQRVAVYLDPQTDSRIKEVLDRSGFLSLFFFVCA